MMDSPTQVAVGIGLGYLVSRLVARKKPYPVVANRRKKKFVRVRGHMRCMPRKHKKESKAEPTVIERVVEKVNEVVEGPSWSKGQRPESVKLEVPEHIELSANELGDDEPTQPAIPSTIAQSVRATAMSESWPDVAQIEPAASDSGFMMADIPWRTIIIVGSIAAGLVLLGSYTYQQQAPEAPEVTP
jgi:hypothetical protein